MLLSDALKKLEARHQKLTLSPTASEADWLGLEAEFQHLLNQFPDNVKLNFGLGTLSMQIGKSGVALALLEKSLTLGAPGAGPWLNMAGAHKAEHRDEEAASCYRKALEIADAKPELDGRGINLAKSQALHGMASLYVNAGAPHKCMEWADKALETDPTDRFALWNKGLALLEAGDWEEGFRIYDEAGFAESQFKSIERKLKTYGGLPRWEGEKGKTVITYGEQGVGDEIMLLSMLPDLMRDCKVIVDCDKRLENLIRRAFPGLVAVYPTSDINAPFPWVKDHKIDGYVPMGSLGKYYRKRADKFLKLPYLNADPALVMKWREILEPYKGYRVAISWAGGMKKTRMDMRTIPLEQWEPILKTKGCEFFSLQYHPWAADDAARVGTLLGVPIHHWGDVVQSYDETAAFLANMDLVVTVNTSLHHLVGALGVNQWCLCPKYIAWRYGIKGPSPWYGNCTMLRQEKPGEWGDVLADVVKRLDKRVMQKAAA